VIADPTSATWSPATQQPIFDAIASRYPNILHPFLSDNRARFLWEAAQVTSRLKPPGHILDLGCGLSPVPLICAQAGFQVTVMDDFHDSFCNNERLSVLEFHREQGINIVDGDLFSVPVPRPHCGFDGIICLHSMEHWNRSPKRLFRDLCQDLKPGGIFLLGAPNCANLRKRLTLLAGRGKWSSMKDWYEEDVFRGHVREPDVDDLTYLARDLGFRNYRVHGKNWMGFRSPNALIRILTALNDPVLRLRSSLCSDIYLLAVRDAVPPR
jgi:SAM-dependent methyltransferase